MKVEVLIRVENDPDVEHGGLALDLVSVRREETLAFSPGDDVDQATAIGALSRKTEEVIDGAVETFRAKLLVAVDRAKAGS